MPSQSFTCLDRGGKAISGNALFRLFPALVKSRYAWLDFNFSNWRCLNCIFITDIYVLVAQRKNIVPTFASWQRVGSLSSGGRGERWPLRDVGWIWGGRWRGQSDHCWEPSFVVEYYLKNSSTMLFEYCWSGVFCWVATVLLYRWTSDFG